MKVAFSTSGRTLESPLDPRFGRCPALLIYDLSADSFDLLDNGGSVQAAQGAGIRTAEALVRAGAQALVTGHVGPKAFRALDAAGVKIHPCDAPTVREALARYRAGELARTQGPDVKGHW